MTTTYQNGKNAFVSFLINDDYMQFNAPVAPWKITLLNGENSHCLRVSFDADDINLESTKWMGNAAAFAPGIVGYVSLQKAGINKTEIDVLSR